MDLELAPEFVTCFVWWPTAMMLVAVGMFFGWLVGSWVKDD